MNENQPAKAAIEKEIASQKANARVLHALSAALREFPADRKRTLREEKKINQFLIDRGIENADISFCGSQWVAEIKVRFGPAYPWHSVSMYPPKRADGLHGDVYPFHPECADKAESDALECELAANGREIILQNIDERISEAELLYKQAIDAVRGFREAVAGMPYEAREILFNENRFADGKELDKVYSARPEKKK